MQVDKHAARHKRHRTRSHRDSKQPGGSLNGRYARACWVLQYVLPCVRAIWRAPLVGIFVGALVVGALVGAQVCPLRVGTLVGAACRPLVGDRVRCACMHVAVL